MKTKNLDREQTIKLIDYYKKRIEFNNKLNAFARKFMKERGLDDWHKFNGYHDEPTPEMKETMLKILNDNLIYDLSWMSMKLKSEYLRYTGAIFGQVYGPHVNEYVRKDLHDLEAHLQELENASNTREEENSEFRVERDLATNRLNLYFDDVPNEEARRILKKNGFRWSPHLSAWTRQLTQNAENSLAQIKKEMGIN